jgi:hypothetical protein
VNSSVREAPAPESAGPALVTSVVLFDEAVTVRLAAAV